MASENDEVLKWFRRICDIPHGSGNMKDIQEFCINFAESRKLEYKACEDGSVVIYKPASKTYETEPLVLQAHLDMVCVHDEGTDWDISKEGVKANWETDVIRGTGTSLGADDGIGVAMILAVLDSKIAHPPIEAVLTANEETSMCGARDLPRDWVQGREMINLDAEKEGVIYAGSAGGSSVKCIIPLDRSETQGRQWKIAVRNCTGGHSGINIAEGRGNANKIMGEVLKNLDDITEFSMVSFSGGTRGNVIPGASEAVILCREDFEFSPFCKKQTEKMRKIYGKTDPEVIVEALPESDTCITRKTFSKKSRNNIIDFTVDAPDGVVEMSQVTEGLPETSLNLGIIKTEDDDIIFQFSCRSSRKKSMDGLERKLTMISQEYGGQTLISDGIPPWQFREKSYLREVCKSVFARKNGGESPRVQVTHGGTECGFFKEKWEDMDCIAIGPDIHDVHSVNEWVDVQSVKRTWDLLKAILEEMAHIYGESHE